LSPFTADRARSTEIAHCIREVQAASPYASLLAVLRDRKAHAVLAGIAVPIEASIALHEKLQFNRGVVLGAGSLFCRLSSRDISEE
jgi:hypothetical protein